MDDKELIKQLQLTRVQDGLRIAELEERCRLLMIGLEKEEKDCEISEVRIAELEKALRSITEVVCAGGPSYHYDDLVNAIRQGRAILEAK